MTSKAIIYNCKDLKIRWENFKQANPKSRIRDAARELGTNEATLLVTGIGLHVKLLTGDFKELMKDVSSLGHVMALTRNDHAVHERKGTYLNVSFNSHVGLVLGEDIDLRLFMGDWKYCFSVEENHQKSLQFFNSFGDAVHKIYLTEQSNIPAFESLVIKYLSDCQNQILEIKEKVPQVEEPTKTPNIDEVAFQKEWLNLKDIHHFLGLLRKFKITRKQSFKFAPLGYAYQIEPSSIKTLLEKASENQVPIMVFVSNPNCIQIHTGPIKKIFIMGPWLNILDPEFNLHLSQDAIAEAWVVKKPSTSGIITSVELLDKNGATICQFFGKNQLGIPEPLEWVALIKSL